jgi:hypothetical protein
MAEVETTATSVVEVAEVAEATMTATTETLAAPAMPPRCPPTGNPLLLGNLMVAATLMRDSPVESSDC